MPLSELGKIDALRGADTLRAGIPVSIEIPLRKRTALAYAFEPLTRRVPPFIQRTLSLA